MTSKLQLRRESIGWTVAEVSELSDISESVIYRIEREDTTYKVNVLTAEALAAALDCKKVDELFSSNELSTIGRPPHTGRPLLAGHHTVSEMLCPDCFMLVPADVGCEFCGLPALPAT